MTLTKIKDVILGIAVAVAGIAVLPLVPIVALFRGPTVRVDIVLGIRVERYALPTWLAWFDTPDEYLPGGLYEPRVVDSLINWSSHYFTAVQWLAANRLYGLSWRFGLRTSGYGAYPWRWRKETGPLVWLAGWKVHRATYDASEVDGPFIAIPFVSVRLARNG